MQWCFSKRAYSSVKCGSTTNVRYWIWNFGKLQLLVDMPKMWSFELSWLFFSVNSLNWEINTDLHLCQEKKEINPQPLTQLSPVLSKDWIFFSISINGIRSKILELLAFRDVHQPHVVAIQETKIDSTITSELFPETCMYSVYRKDRHTHGGGVMLLIHRDISHMPTVELENSSESVWVKYKAG